MTEAVWGEILDIIHWFIFLVMAIDSGQVLSHHKGGSHNVVCYSYQTQTLSPIGAVQCTWLTRFLLGSQVTRA